jgi:tetratricopeptide (TPR) repeat protein
MGLSYEALKEFSKAKECYNKAVELEKENFERKERFSTL